ncbi:hypothetical protein BH20ACT16_BH20ACT16_07030 [soil metagenome]
MPTENRQYDRRAVAGNRVDVRQMLQPNADPHEYEPRPSDVIGP